MTTNIQLVLVIVITFLLSACEAIAPIVIQSALLSAPAPSGAVQGFESETAINPSKLLPVKTIALLEIPEPPNYGRDTRFAQQNAKYDGLSFGKSAQAVLKKQLEDYGFEVIDYSLVRENSFRLVSDYSRLDIEGADAYLDVVPVEVEYKFWWATCGPHVSTSFRLVSVVSNEEIYAGSIQYGWKDANARSAGVRIESPEDHKFESSDFLKANKAVAAEWLVLGIEAISSSIGEKIVEGKLIGLAENELVTETYDQSLWAKALVEVEGDETKRNAKYIELRANQLFVDKDEATTIASAVVPTSIKKTRLTTERNSESTSTLNLTGTYRSAITSSSSYVLGKRKYKNLTFELKQDGDEISGRSLEENIEIRGILNDNTVKFEIAPVQATGNWWLRGIWKISRDGTQLTGRWSQPKLEARGRWNLERLQ